MQHALHCIFVKTISKKECTLKYIKEKPKSSLGVMVGLWEVGTIIFSAFCSSSAKDWFSTPIKSRNDARLASLANSLTCLSPILDSHNIH